MKFLIPLLLATVLLATSCLHNSRQSSTSTATDILTDTCTADTATPPQPAKSHTARQLDSLGYLNIAETDSTIAVDLM